MPEVTINLVHSHVNEKVCVQIFVLCNPVNFAYQHTAAALRCIWLTSQLSAYNGNFAFKSAIIKLIVKLTQRIPNYKCYKPELAVTKPACVYEVLVIYSLFT